MPFAPNYIPHVLSENVQDAKELFLSPRAAVEARV